MLDLIDCDNIEGGNADFFDVVLSTQKAINAGLWLMPGSYGRTMMRAIDAGDCMLGLRPVRDAYGNRIPSRDEVKPGTKGSVEFVLARHNQEWVDHLLRLEA